MNANLLQVARRFSAGQFPNDITPLGNGLINDTFLVEADSGRFVLQRINPLVFPQPQRVMDNLLQLGLHMQQKPTEMVRLQIPAIIRTTDGKPFFQDDEGHIWRALQLISPAESREQIDRVEEAAQVGFALAHFHRLCSDLPTERLHDTLPGFHVTPGYFRQYQEIVGGPLTVETDEAFSRCTGFIEVHCDDLAVLEEAKQRGQLQPRVIHGDPKLNNFLFLPGSDRIISLIDLDTVKPGLLHYDIGDCLRSCCRVAEDNSFDLRRSLVILESYLQEAGEFFSAADYEYLYSAIWLIPFELGLRFFSDYLAGDRYFKTSVPRQNLNRALAQFALCESIGRQRQALEQQLVAMKKRYLIG